jgi:Fic family protein
MKPERIESQIPDNMVAVQLQELVGKIEEQKKIIDRNLKKPAKWRGLARRETAGHNAPEIRESLAHAHNNLIECFENNAPLNVDLILQVHKDAGNSGEFRKGGVRVGKKDPVFRPHSSKVPGLVEKSLARADDGLEPPPLAASRLHLEILIIHPFSDSNGRVARLMASFLLMRAGYRSTLLTAVEQHFQVQPRAYVRSFKILRAGGEKDHGRWLITTLEAMLFNSMKAAWFRERQDDLIAAAQGIGISEDHMTKTLLDYDLGIKTKKTGKLTKATGKTTPPLIKATQQMPTDEKSAIITQVERLYLEEIDEGHEDEYVQTILDTLKRST